MVYYVMAQHSDLVFFLLERKSSSLRQLFEDAKGVEENIQDCKMLRDQAHVEDIQAYEQEEECRYHSDLRQFSSSFSDFHMNKDINDACVDSSYQFADFFDDNILSVDYSRNFLVPSMRLSCYEEEVAALQPLTIDIRNKFPFLTYGHFQNFICSSFDQGFYLKVKK